MPKRIRITKYKTLDGEIIHELTGEYGTVFKETDDEVIVIMDNEKWNASGTLTLFKGEFEYV